MKVLDVSQEQFPVPAFELSDIGNRCTGFDVVGFGLNVFDVVQ